MISTTFSTYLLVTHSVVWHDTFANSTWLVLAFDLDLKMVHGFDEVARAGEQSKRISFVFLALAWFFTLLRIWTRTWIIASFGWDDAAMILACVRCKPIKPNACFWLTKFQMIFSVFSASSIYIADNGGGTHVTSLEGLEKLTKVSVTSTWEDRADCNSGSL